MIEVSTYISLLHHCRKFESLSGCSRVHSHLLRHGKMGGGSAAPLANTLAQVYSACGCLALALSFFRAGVAPCLDAFSWNTLLSSFNRRSRFREALDLFFVPGQTPPPEPNRFTFLAALSASTGLRALADGKRIHRRILQEYPLFLSDVSIATSLLSMYGRCGDIASARLVFDGVLEKDTVAWNAMISAYAQTGHFQEAMDLSLRMRMEGATPNRVTFLSLLSDIWSAHSSREIHSLIVSYGIETDLASKVALLSMYAKCGFLDRSRSIFDRIDKHSMVSINSMLHAYARNGKSKEALDLFDEMGIIITGAGLKPNRVTSLCLINACASLACLEKGRAVWKLVIDNHLESDDVLLTAFIDMYGKCGSLDDAESIFFSKMREKDGVAWNAMIGAYARNGQGKKALELFLRMDSDSDSGSDSDSKKVKPDKVTFLSLLNACASLASLHEGRAVHDRLIRSGIKLDTTLNTSLLNMYGKCGSLGDARSVFDGMHHRNVVSWCSMLAAYTQNGHTKEALELLRPMIVAGIKPDQSTCLHLLNACSAMESLEDGRLLHSRIVALGVGSDLPIKSALVNMYGKCGSPLVAHSLFDRMHERDLISWNALLTAYVQKKGGGHSSKEALELFRRMELEGVKPDKVSFLCLLSACDGHKSLPKGRTIHGFVVANRSESDVLVNTSLLSMYGRCGRIIDSRSVFDRMPQRDLIAWNAMLATYAQNAHVEEALKLFRRMAGIVEPDKVTFITLLNACAASALLCDGRALHECVVANGVESGIDVKNALLNMYAKCGSLEEARSIFDRIDQRNVMSWNVMLAAYAEKECGEVALELFGRMKSEGIEPNRATFLSLLEACESMATLEGGREIHECISTSGFESDAGVKNALIQMYGKCGSLGSALELFQRMGSGGIEPNKATLLCLLKSCATTASLSCGREIHKYIAMSGIGDVDIAVQNALLYMYGKCGSLDDACSLFDGMHQRNEISWSSMFLAYAQNGYIKEALETYRQMDLLGVKPDKVTFLSVLNACSHACLLDEAWRYFISMGHQYGITPSKEHYKCVIDLLGRAGCLNEAKALLLNMPIKTDPVALSSSLGVGRIHGNMEQWICMA